MMSDTDAREEGRKLQTELFVVERNDLEWISAADSVDYSCFNSRVEAQDALESETDCEGDDRDCYKIVRFIRENMAAESQRTQAPSETRTKLLTIAAKVARREYVPSLDNCRTISDARAEVRRMDDLHAQLAWELKTVVDALARTQAPSEQSVESAADEILDYLDECTDFLKREPEHLIQAWKRETMRIIAGTQSQAAQPEEKEFKNETRMVMFRAGLLACREYMARFVESESPSIAASIRANWPKLGPDPGPPRKLRFDEVTDGSELGPWPEKKIEPSVEHLR